MSQSRHSSTARGLALASVLFILSLNLLPSPIARAQIPPQTHTITWDSHSLLIDGRRVLIYSGEFHYWRLPSQSQWLDRLEKMKAAGLNAVSIYFDWQYHSFAPDQYDFTGVRDIDYLLSLTDRLGLYVIARVGPYMNAEDDAGGLPGWLLRQPLFLRDQSWNGSTAVPQASPLYEQYAKEWFDHLLPILARHQVTSGGSVLLLSIENEYSQQSGSLQYMRDLYEDARADGIDVPIFTNDYWFNGDWKSVVDLYAWDSYPYGFQCCHEWYDIHFHGVDTWESHARSQLGITSTPMFVAELQGGMYDGWGGKGYATVAKTLGPGWLTDLDTTALSQGTTILNTYMFAGGTSWGYMSAPDVYTSYDYGAPLSETGQLRPAYYSAHRLGAFLQSFGESLAGADAAPTAAVPTNPAVVAHARVNGQNGQVFVFLRHGDPGAPLLTKVHLTIGQRSWVIPQRAGTAISIPGHDAAILTGNVDIGTFHLNYSTSQVLYSVETAQGPYLVLYGPAGSSGETDFTLPSVPVEVVHDEGVRVTKTNGELRLNYRHTVQPRTVAIRTSTGVLRLIIISTDQASRFWFDDDMLIAGPDLVTDDNGTLHVSNTQMRDVRLFGAQPGSSLDADGKLTAAPDDVMGEILAGNLAGPGSVALPTLSNWKFAPESPEIQPEFDDSSWQVANHSGTANPNVPASSMLLADDYGFHYGFVWYRGHFVATGNETGITLQARQCYSVYLNGTYLGSAEENMATPPHTYAQVRTFPFPRSALRPGQDNVIAVLTESMGHDEGWLAGPLAQSPQGILAAQIDGAPTTVMWRIQGDEGGETPPDMTRGLLNASGLFGERNGWYLPDFNDGGWSTVQLPDDWKARDLAIAVGWYRTTFALNLPGDGETPIGLDLPRVSDQAVIWLNGWLIGRYWQQMGPQHTFYLPEGVLNPHGENTLAIAVWNMGNDGGLLSRPQLVLYSALRSHTLDLADPVPTSDGYWHTSGNLIVDSAGRPVRIDAVNWGGMQTSAMIPSGLDHQPVDTIMSQIASFGFNTVRLPFSNQAIEQNPVIRNNLQANLQLQGLHVLDILDRIVASARNHGLRIILDDHRSDVGNDPEENGLWYTKQYPETAWIRDWEMLVTRYEGDPTVVGVDLRDEPHTAPPGPWTVNTYLHHGATWGPYHGIENPATDWSRAAERAGDAVLAINPHLLIFVEGLQQYPDPTQPGGLDSYWWGGVLQPARRFPVQLDVPHQLVYSPHEYGPEKYAMPFFGPKMTYASLSRVWERHWGFLLRQNGGTPIFVGEFGTCGTSPSCIDSQQPGSQGLWFRYWLRFLREHSQIGWAFWAVNGTNSVGSDQPNYIFRNDWSGPRLHQLLDALRDVEYAPPPG